MTGTLTHDTLNPWRGRNSGSARDFARRTEILRVERDADMRAQAIGVSTAIWYPTGPSMSW